MGGQMSKAWQRAYLREWRKQNPDWRRGLAKYRVRGPRVLILGVMVNWRNPCQSQDSSAVIG
jgi:hypothetical protein